MARRPSFAIALAAMVCAASNTFAQEAEQAGGPLTLVGISDTSVMAMTPPQPAADQRTETWLWFFFGDRQTASTITYDTIAFRLSLDCATVTGERLGYELYRDSTFTYRAPPAVTPYTADNIMRIMCAQGRQVETFADHRAGRAAATAHFARQAQ